MSTANCLLIHSQVVLFRGVGSCMMHAEKAISRQRDRIGRT